MYFSYGFNEDLFLKYILTKLASCTVDRKTIFIYRQIINMFIKDKDRAKKCLLACKLVHSLDKDDYFCCIFKLCMEYKLLWNVCQKSFRFMITKLLNTHVPLDQIILKYSSIFCLYHEKIIDDFFINHSDISLINFILLRPLLLQNLPLDDFEKASIYEDLYISFTSQFMTVYMEREQNPLKVAFLWLALFYNTSEYKNNYRFIDYLLLLLPRSIDALVKKIRGDDVMIKFLQSVYYALSVHIKELSFSNDRTFVFKLRLCLKEIQLLLSQMGQIKGNESCAELIVSGFRPCNKLDQDCTDLLLRKMSVLEMNILQEFYRNLMLPITYSQTNKSIYVNLTRLDLKNIIGIYAKYTILF